MLTGCRPGVLRTRRALRAPLLVAGLALLGLAPLATATGWLETLEGQWTGAAEVTPIKEIGTYTFEPGTVCETLLKDYMEEVQPKKSAAAAE